MLCPLLRLRLSSFSTKPQWLAPRGSLGQSTIVGVPEPGLATTFTFSLEDTVNVCHSVPTFLNVSVSGSGDSDAVVVPAARSSTALVKPVSALQFWPFALYHFPRVNPVNVTGDVVPVATPPFASVTAVYVPALKLELYSWNL